MKRAQIACLTALLVVLSTAVIPSAAMAGTSIQGKVWTITLNLSPDSYVPYSGNLSKGEQTAFALTSDAPIDVFAFNQSQYDNYSATGRLTPGYSGPAVWSALGVTNVEALLTASSSDRYYLVIDNTVAGEDPGSAAKTVDLQIIYPISPIETNSLALFVSLLAICGIVLLAVMLVSVLDFSAKKD